MTWRLRLRIRYWGGMPPLRGRVISYVRTRDHAVVVALVGVPTALCLGAAMAGHAAALFVVPIGWAFLRDAVAWFSATDEERLAFSTEVLVRQFDVSTAKVWASSLDWEPLLIMVGVGLVTWGLVARLPVVVMLPGTVIGLPLLSLVADRLDGV